MEKDSAKFDLLKRYLLGQLPEEEMQSIELQYLTDESFFDELLNAETELITQYQSGRLSPEEHEQFESCFLRSAERRNRVEATQQPQNPNEVVSFTLIQSLATKVRFWWHRWLARLGINR